MGFLICCDNKGCFQMMEPLLDIKTNDVICTECGKPINSVTSFAKIQMKSLGQTTRIKRATTSWAVECRYCGASLPPTIKPDGKIVCSHCSAHLDYLSEPFVRSFLASK